MTLNEKILLAFYRQLSVPRRALALGLIFLQRCKHFFGQVRNTD